MSFVLLVSGRREFGHATRDGIRQRNEPLNLFVCNLQGKRFLVCIDDTVVLLLLLLVAVAVAVVVVVVVVMFVVSLRCHVHALVVT